MNAYRPLTLTDVLDTAVILMCHNGNTTTLEVKQHLRNRGFWAIQSQVSALMFELALEMDWQVADTGRFRVYYPTTDEQEMASYNFESFNLN